MFGFWPSEGAKRIIRNATSFKPTECTDILTLWRGLDSRLLVIRDS